RSAALLRAPTVGDAYKLNTNGAGRVVSIAVKDRSALFLGGTSADLALWFELETGEFASTTCYAPGPPPWLPRHPAASFADWNWTLSRPDAIARLVPEDREPGAVPRYELGPTFPHKLVPGKHFFEAVRNSPASTILAVKVARAAAQALALGQSGKTDLLALAVSAVDGVGHQFGSLARERVDTVLRAHDELSSFLDELRGRLGPRLSIVLTADHGLTPMEADQKRLRVTQGGTESIDALIDKLNRALDEALGPRREGWVATIDGSTVTLRPPFPPRAVQLATDLLRREPGFWRVVPFNEIDQAEPAIRHAYHPGRSGQILLVPRPLWALKKANDGADHGSPWNDDALVPLMIQAPGFRLRRDAVFRATQIAPTIAALLDTPPPAAALDSPAIEHE
ncbi:MAG: alkaline phosphatase family protein, partial [Myxococcales bacterium]|nr:alkaline phosphatase family protein [Myxococcales bacterium]